MSSKLNKNLLISRQQVHRNFGLSVRFLEECHRKTKLTGELVGPIFLQLENTVKYKVQHLEEYIEKCVINNETAENLEKKCESSKKICIKYKLAKKEKKTPHIPHTNNQNDRALETRNKKTN